MLPLTLVFIYRRHDSFSIGNKWLFNERFFVFLEGCVYLLSVDKFLFFKFLPVSDKPPGPGKNYHCQSFIVQTSLNYSICTRKGKYSILKTNTKFHQLTKHTKIWYSIASLSLCQFPCVIYGDGLNQSTSRVRHSSYLANWGPF